MKPINYFGFTQSESLNGVKRMALSLSRDLESLKEDGITPVHLAKLQQLISSAEEAGTLKQDVLPQFENTVTKEQVRKDVLNYINRIEKSLNLLMESEVASHRYIDVRGLRSASVNGFGEKLNGFIGQIEKLFESRKDIFGEVYWLTQLRNMANNYVNALDERTTQRTVQKLNTAQRNEAIYLMTGYARLLAKAAHAYWKSQNSVLADDYMAVNPRKKAVPDTENE